MATTCAAVNPAIPAPITATSIVECSSVAMVSITRPPLWLVRLLSPTPVGAGKLPRFSPPFLSARSGRCGGGGCLVPGKATVPSLGPEIGLDHLWVLLDFVGGAVRDNPPRIEHVDVVA